MPHISKSSRPRSYGPQSFGQTGDGDDLRRGRIASEPAPVSVIGDIVIDVLRRSTPGELSDAQRESFRKLETKPMPIVLTGQQVGLFGGPLLNLAKIASVFAAKRHLAEHAVPIFWLQSEDHDLREIDCYRSLRPNGEIVDRFLIDRDDSILQRHIPVDQLQLPSSVLELLSEVQNDQQFHRFGSKMSTALQQHYQPERSWVDAFTGFFNELFRETGLLFFNPRLFSPAESRSLTSAIYSETFERRHAIEERLQSHADSKSLTDTIVQVTVRRNSPLFFVEMQGERFRLIEHGGMFSAIIPKTHPEFDQRSQVQLSESEVHRIILQETRRLSPSALLRPLIQEEYFPNAHYIGGEAEVSYFQQTEQYADVIQRRAPRIVRRSSFRIVEPRVKEISHELQLPLEILLSDSPEARQAIADAQGVLSRQLLEKEATELLDHMTSRWSLAARQVDQTLLGSLEKLRNKLEQTLTGFLDRYEAAVLRGDDIRIKRIERIRTALRPHGIEQERFYSGVPYLAQFGSQLFEEMVVRAEIGAAEPVLLWFDRSTNQESEKSHDDDLPAL